MAISGNTTTTYVKSFFAATVKEALEQAHKELGPDALLLNAREAPPEARHLGGLRSGLGRFAASPCGCHRGETVRPSIAVVRSTRPWWH